MPKWSGKFVGPPHINNGHRFAALESPLELAWLDPCERSAQPLDQSRQYDNCREKSEREKTITYSIRFAAQRLASGMAEPRISNRTRRHADERGDNVVVEWNVCEAEHVIG